METLTLHDRDWLERFPSLRRATLANMYHAAVRAGARTPEAVLSDVARTLRRRLASPWITPEQQSAWEDARDSLTTARDLALQYAAAVLAYEALPDAERQAVKAARSTRYQRQWMTTQPVTEKQCAFLRALGYTGVPPGNRAEASALIDALQGGRKHG